MTTEEIGKKFFTLFIAAVTFCVLGSFVVSLNIIDFLYLIFLYVSIYRCYKFQKEEKENDEELY